MTTGAGERFVAALAARDTAALLALLAPGVVFSGLTPGRTWEAVGPDAVVHDVLYRWFEPTDVVEDVLEVQEGEVAGRPRVDYRLSVRNADGLHLVEQHAYYDVDEDGRVARMQAVCAGFRAVGDA